MSELYIIEDNFQPTEVVRHVRHGASKVGVCSSFGPSIPEIDPILTNKREGRNVSCVIPRSGNYYVDRVRCAVTCDNTIFVD